MARQILTLSDLGHEGVWLLVQQACGIPDARARSSFLSNMTVLLLFAQDSFPERLCVTAAVRQMGGHVVYVDEGAWKKELIDFPQEMSHIVSYYVDCAVAHGLDASAMRRASATRTTPLINGGGPDAHPAHVLADIACMMQHTPDLNAVRVAWLGGVNGTLCSLMESLQYFPFSLRVALPQRNPDDRLLQYAATAPQRVSFVDSPAEAVRGANYIYAGCVPQDNPAWNITQETMKEAAHRARILLSSTSLCGVSIEHELLQSKASLLYKQAEHRLRVNKRMLHWVFSDE